MFFYKSAKGGEKIANLFESLESKGFAVVAQDEEAGIIYDNYSAILFVCFLSDQIKKTARLVRCG